MGASESTSCGSTSAQSAESAAYGSCSIRKINEEEICIKDGPIEPDWGSEGISIYLIRVALDFNFHWGLAIECNKERNVVVINRDQGGLAISCNHEFDQAIEITMCYLLNQEGGQGNSTLWKAAKKSSSALKSVAYLPR